LHSGDGKIGREFHQEEWDGAVEDLSRVQKAWDGTGRRSSAKEHLVVR